VEVVYSKDSFRSIKKDKDNDVETYEFKINDAFDRGEIVGGFYYHRYTDDPKRNKIVVFNMNEINKRKPKHASTEFWGGEKVIYENGEKTKKTEKVEGWLDQMVYKTLYRAAYGDITIDSQKIDDDFINLAESERTSHEIPDTETEVTTIINNNANKQELDIEEAQQVSETPITEDKKEPVKSEAKPGF
jgi:recombination protein RecT